MAFLCRATNGVRSFHFARRQTNTKQWTEARARPQMLSVLRSYSTDTAELDLASKDNHRPFLDAIAKKLNIKGTPSEWYDVPQTKFREFQGVREVLRHYGGSMYMALKTIYPEHSFQFWKFKRTTTTGDISGDQEREFFEYARENLQINNLNDWYKVSKTRLHRIGGGQILQKYDGDLCAALQAVYPDHEFVPWKFRRTTKGLFTNIDVVVEFLKWAEKDLEIDDPEEWYRISRSQWDEIGGGALWTTYRQNLFKAFDILYPEHEFSEEEFRTRVKKSTQRLLCKKTQKVYPDNEVFEDYQDPDIKYDDDLPVEFDIYIPELKLALEYQGEHHFHDNPGYFGPARLYAQADERKVEVAKAHGVTVVPIPYWWDRNIDTVKATIHYHRPDLMPKDQVPEGARPLIMDVDNFTPPGGAVEDRLSVNDFMHGADYAGQPVEGWWMCEKLDGIRALWDGKRLYSRKGNFIPAPPPFLERLPEDTPLEGELWVGRSEFYTLMRQIYASKNWAQIRFHVFDLPLNKADPWEKRYEQMKELIPENDPVLRLVEHEQIKNKDHMQKKLDEIIGLGGEGVVMRKPGHLYTPGTTNSVLKIKEYFDTEVKMIAPHVTEKKSNLLHCEMPNGLDVFVKCTTYDYNNPPPEDSVLTISHQGLAPSGKPRYPFLLRRRHELSWEEVCLKWPTIRKKQTVEK
mmetsp:Transcript_20022/g.22278  ORF Transcript_20022/g.22278 Transcript_20022/m.22278 type:complete len:688 (-) Transcript_20022:161-2224(-)